MTEIERKLRTLRIAETMAASGREFALLVEATAAAVTGGVTPGSAERVSDRLALLRAALGELEAAVAVAVRP